MVANFFISLINLIIKAIGLVLSFLLSILPNSPFTMLSNSPIAPYVPTLNYFIPLSEMLAIGQLWLTAVGVYYIYQIVLRWVKAIE